MGSARSHARRAVLPSLAAVHRQHFVVGEPAAIREGLSHRRRRQWGRKAAIRYGVFPNTFRLDCWLKPRIGCGANADARVPYARITPRALVSASAG